MLIQKQTFEAIGIRKKRALILGIFFAGGFITLFLKLFSLQVIQGTYYRRVADENRILRIYQTASRGLIYDRHHQLLAGRTPSFVVTFTPYSMNQNQVEAVSKQLAGLLRCSLMEVRERTFIAVKPLEPVLVASHVSREIALTIMEKKAMLPGVNVEIQTERYYPNDSLGCHVIGYVGELSLAEYKQKKDSGYRIGDYLGKTGVEAYYDQYLRGEDGEKQIEVSAGGRQLRLLRELPATSGNDIELSLAADLQRETENAIRGKNAAAIVMNPRTGEILALASSPAFNLNSFLRPITREEFLYLFKNKNKPLFNKALQGQYPPGSVFKIVTAAACLQEGYSVPEEKIECAGKYELGTYKQIFRCWKQPGHGHISFLSAFAQSCDVFFYQIGLRLGITRLATYARGFGLGKPTGVDLPSEKKGIVPDRLWKKNVIKEMWYDGDTLNMAIGQGYLWVTPLQIACLMSAVANEGPFNRPTLVRKIISAEGKVRRDFSPEVIGQVELDKKNWQTIKRGLEEAVRAGTGRGAYMRDVRVGGKTGTAQNPQGPDHAWFSCIAPIEDPQIVVVVFVEHGGHGGVVAAPIARQILENYFRKKSGCEEDIPLNDIGD